MATQLPVRIEFRLPNGWTTTHPDQVGAPDAAYVAVYGRPSGGFTANITISGDFRPDGVTLEAIADDSISRLQESVGTVRLRDRGDVGDADVAGLTQALELSALVDQRPRELVQYQVYLSLTDADEPHKRVVLELMLTCATEQLDEVIGDFQEFVRTVNTVGS